MELPGQHLDRHVASKHAVARPVHLAHATDGQHAENAIGTELAAQQRWMIALNLYAAKDLQSWPFEKVTGTCRVRQQRLHFLAKRLVVGTCLVQERSTLMRFSIERFSQKSIDDGPAFVAHPVATCVACGCLLTARESPRGATRHAPSPTRGSR